MRTREFKTKNMKTLLFTLIFSSIAILSFGQGTYDDLRILYADGNYEKLVQQAEKYTLKDDTKKDPMPYLWMGKGLYKLSLQGDVDPEFNNAFKDALGAINKFLKYDKDGQYMADEDNYEFVTTIQKSLYERIDNEVGADNYRKAFSWVIKYKKISNNIIGEMYMEGACKFKTDDKSSAFTLWREADKLVEGITSMDSWTESDIDMFRLGVLKTAECMVSVKQVDKAKILLNKVAQWFEGDEDFKQAYDEIVN